MNRGSAKRGSDQLFVAGVDGCRAGWVCFSVEVTSLATSVEVVDLPKLLSNRPSDLACLGIDIPIGLLDGSRACDKAARKLLGQPRGTSVFAAPCRAALRAKNHTEASAVSRQRTSKGLSQQAWGIASKIKEVDDALTPESQQWAIEVHPEVCFWALSGQHPMANNKEDRRGCERKTHSAAYCIPRHPATSREPTTGSREGRSSRCGGGGVDCGQDARGQSTSRLQP